MRIATYSLEMCCNGNHLPYNLSILRSDTLPAKACGRNWLRLRVIKESAAVVISGTRYTTEVLKLLRLSCSVICFCFLFSFLSSLSFFHSHSFFLRVLFFSLLFFTCLLWQTENGYAKISAFSVETKFSVRPQSELPHCGFSYYEVQRRFIFVSVYTIRGTGIPCPVCQKTYLFSTNLILILFSILTSPKPKTLIF
jgi:hypothetical protein